MTLSKIIIGALGWLCLYSTSFAEVDAIKPELTQLRKDIEAKRQKLDIPAIGLTLVDKDNIIWTGAFGVADRESAKPATVDTVFRIGSITKSFTALATLILVNDGKLRLDEKLKDIAPELPVKNKWQSTHPIRILHLLEHTAGLTDLNSNEFDFNKPLTLEQAFKRGPERVAQWPPGTHHSYTNVGAGILAYVIEKRSGKTYEAFVEQRIFKPLNMTSASFFDDEKTMRQLATGYNTNGYSAIPYWQMTFRAFGAINLKPKDMAPFLHLLLNKGRYQDQTLLPASLIERMEIPTTSLAAQSGLQFGYGSGMYTFFHDGFVFYGHGGDGDGYLSRYGYNRAAKMAYFVVINVFRDSDLVKIRRLIEDFIIRQLPESEFHSIKLKKKELKQYTGTYETASWRFPGSKKQIQIKLDKGQLLLKKQKGKAKKLIPVTKQHFRLKDEPIATMAFVRDEKNRLYLQTDFDNFQKID